jgi:hypothetical protein
MTSAESAASETKGQREYCRFGKRNLDGMSWLAPLVNNRVGDCLNLELRHEQLFFIQGEQVLDDIGYSEKGRRFSEADFGKPIRTLEDLKRNGYWLVGREYDPAIMREALARQKDGYYYSLFSNQCQDWTDRVRRSAERLETERGLACHRLTDFSFASQHGMRRRHEEFLVAVVRCRNLVLHVARKRPTNRGESCIAGVAAALRQ